MARRLSLSLLIFFVAVSVVGVDVVPSSLADNTPEQNRFIIDSLLQISPQLTGDVKAARKLLSNVQADVTNAPCTQNSILEQYDNVWNNAVPQLDLLQYAPDIIAQAISVRDVLHRTVCELLIADSSIQVLHTIDDGRRASLLTLLKFSRTQFSLIVATLNDILMNEPPNPEILDRCNTLEALVERKKAAVKCWETANFFRIQELLEVAGPLSGQVNLVWNWVVSAQTDSWEDRTVQVQYGPVRNILSSSEGLLRDLQLQLDKIIACNTATEQLQSAFKQLGDIKTATQNSAPFGGRKVDLSNRLSTCMATLQLIIDQLLSRLGLPSSGAV